MSQSSKYSKSSLFYQSSKKNDTQSPPKKRNFKAFRWLWRGYLRLCTLIGFFILLSAIISSLTISLISAPSDLEVPPKMVLQLTLKNSIPEKPQIDPVLAAFGVSKPSLYEMTEALKLAKDDEQIQALVMELRPGIYTPSQLEELRAALADFKKSEKPMLIYAPSYDAASAGISTYYLASIFDEIWLQPVGMLNLSGFHAEQPFLADSMEWIGIKANVFKRKEYKTAMENISDSSMSAENREMLTALLNDFHETLSKTASNARNISDNDFAAQINKAILTDEEALEANLIDRLGYGDELIHELNERLGGTKEEFVPYIGLEQYITFKTHGSLSTLQILKRLAKSKMDNTDNGSEEIALIFAQGPIIQYAPENHGLNLGNKEIAASRLVEWIHDATGQDNIKTIVLRIDSPGGSPTASESIRRALVYAKGEGKRIVVSMGSTAASGGYWIASGADYIFANEMTITGSIGVVGAKFDMSALWQKLMINWEAISTADNTDLFSTSIPLSDGGRGRYETMMDSIYDAFLNRVAENRKISLLEADKIAKGRVWGGKRAHENGLIDETGGLQDALLWAAKDIGHDSVDSAGIVMLPDAQPSLNAIFSLLGASVKQVIKGAQSISALEQSQIGQALKHSAMYKSGIQAYIPSPL